VILFAGGCCSSVTLDTSTTDFLNISYYNSNVAGTYTIYTLNQTVGGRLDAFYEKKCLTPNAYEFTKTC
jgi:hypothetical protein